MKKVTALSAALALATTIFVGVEVARADEPASSPVIQPSAERGLTQEPLIVDQDQPSGQQEQLPEGQILEQNEPVSEQSPQSDQE